MRRRKAVTKPKTMGSRYKRSPLQPSVLEESDDDEYRFAFGSDSDAEYESSDDSSEVHASHDQLPQFEPKDPRSKAKYNIFSRLVFLLVVKTYLWQPPGHVTCKCKAGHGHAA